MIFLIGQPLLRKMVESEFFLDCVISYILHLTSAADEKQGNNYSSTILWASQHQPNVLATHVFHKTLHISWINGSKFCPSSDVRGRSVWSRSQLCVLYSSWELSINRTILYWLITASIWLLYITWTVKDVRSVWRYLSFHVAVSETNTTGCSS